MIYFVKNWRTFQHYKDRNPPWVKLHFALLTSSDWVTLDDSARVLAIVCMLVASRSEGKIDGSAAGLAYLQRVAYLKRKPDLTPLIKCGFLECASKTEQEIQNARPETEGPTETEYKKKNGGANGNAVAYIPLVGGKEWGVSPEFLSELETAYPAVDGAATLREIRAWCVSNPAHCKTQSGVRRFINGWFARDQNRGA